MSQENVEVARRLHELVNRGDLEGMAALLAPDIVCFPGSDQPESEPFRGRDAFLEYGKGWLEAFDRYLNEPGEFLDLGECVVVVGRLIARGRGSGVDTSATDAWLYRFRDGKVIEYRECGTKQRALEAAGVRESAMSQENVELARRTTSGEPPIRARRSFVRAYD